jgi:hypothetical protein
MRTDNATAAETPIACTLDAGGFKQRLAWIAELNRDALRGHEREGLVLQLRYDAKAADRVKEMVRREKQCCAFLRFDVRHEGNDVLLTITSPTEARIAAETLFEQFITRGQSDATTPARVATSLRPAPSTFRILGIATFLLALAVFWPFIEPEIARAFGP